MRIGVEDFGLSKSSAHRFSYIRGEHGNPFNHYYALPEVRRYRIPKNKKTPIFWDVSGDLTAGVLVNHWLSCMWMKRRGTNSPQPFKANLSKANKNSKQELSHVPYFIKRVVRTWCRLKKNLSFGILFQILFLRILARWQANIIPRVKMRPWKYI